MLHTGKSSIVAFAGVLSCFLMVFDDLQVILLHDFRIELALFSVVRIVDLFLDQILFINRLGEPLVKSNIVVGDACSRV